MNQAVQLYAHFQRSSGISTDTRSIKKGNLYFALKGDNFDGNKYAQQAIDSGAVVAVVDNPDLVENDSFFLVNDVLEALQELATYHRQQLGIPIIGLTGSNGKTTTKELIREVLKTNFNVSATEGNFNNHIGVPLTLLSMNEQTEVGVVEMGANHIGEIATLCKIAQPTHGLITNIGKAHLEGFGSYEGVLRAKSELYHYLIKSDGQIFANSEDHVLVNMTKRAKNTLFYNSSADFSHSILISADPYVKFKTEASTAFETNLIGQYNFKNIAAALCLGKFFKVDVLQSCKAIANYIPSNNRSQIINSGSNTIILDAYNANPVSMLAALENLNDMSHKKKIVILGDMFELGGDEASEHQIVAKRVSQMDLAGRYLAGKASSLAAAEYDSFNSFTDTAALIEHLKNEKPENALILIKGSRGMGLEKVAELL